MRQREGILFVIMCVAVKLAATDSSVSTVSDTDDDGEGYITLTGNLIPPSPQAASIARFGTYPVNHTTGVPDISIPVYEVKCGDFSLPVSLSYHASGIKVDDLTSTVGLGWSLNAGGCITRTIMGVPDEMVSGENATWFRDWDNFDDMVNSRSTKTYTSGYIDDICDNGVRSQWDTEVDRFTFNFCGFSGVFRYSREEKRFVPLNYSPLRITCNIGNADKGEIEWFRVEDADGNIYNFDQTEYTGVSDEEGNTYASAWYLTSVKTPRGTIELDYKLDASQSYKARRWSQTGSVGKTYQLNEGNDLTDPYYEPYYRVNLYSSQYTDFVFTEARLSAIRWNGNKVEFSYSKDRPHAIDRASATMLDRLTAITVISSDNERRKTVTLDNNHYWDNSESATYDHLTRRMLLKGLTDSDTGDYTFEYNLDNQLHNPANSNSHRDIWGYDNGLLAVSHIPPDVFYKAIDGLSRDEGVSHDDLKKKITFTDSRLSVEVRMLSGSIKSITYPTDGKTVFTFEANRIPQTSGSETITGGLRIKKIENISGSKVVDSRSYTYLSVRENFPNPYKRMLSLSFNLYTLTIGIDIVRSYDAMSSASFSPTEAESCPVFYYSVKETRGDGKYVIYNYDRGNCVTLDSYEDDNGAKEFMHPSLWPSSLYDEGFNSPLLVSKTSYDATGVKTSSEEFEYSNMLSTEFPTGVRVHKAVDWAYSHSSLWGVKMTTYLKAPYFYYKPTRAFTKSFQTMRKVSIDLTTGLSTEQTYSYDEALRTLIPRTVSSLNSIGTCDSVVTTFVFDKTDADSQKLIDDWYCYNAVASVSRYSNGILASRILYDYTSPYGSGVDILPSRVLAAIGNATPIEKERILSRDSHRNPTAALINMTDTIRYKWDNDDCLMQYTAPGGLITNYSWRHLFGIAAITPPTGITTSYEYDSAGRLSSLSDSHGLRQSWSYNYASSGGQNLITSQIYLSASSSAESRVYYDGFGRQTTTVAAGGNTAGKYIFSHIQYDTVGRKWRTWSRAAGSTTPYCPTDDDMPELSFSCFNDSTCYSDITYDALDRPIKETTPGKDWHDANSHKTVDYITNCKNDVKLYTAPIGSTSLLKSGYYPEKSLSGQRTVDEDGISITIFTDRHGRKVLERRGDDNDTYFVYNDYGQLRFVLSPEYQNSGYREKYAYEYRYDSSGNVVKKFIPGASYTQYWYDRAGRIIFMQDPNLRDKNRYRFIIYDRVGRQVIQGTTLSCDRSDVVNFATYVGVGCGFASTGYSVEFPLRILNPEIETVYYYDGNYPNISESAIQLPALQLESPLGLMTGSVEYTSCGDALTTAIIYNVHGQPAATLTIYPDGYTSLTTTEYSYTNQPKRINILDSRGLTTSTSYEYDTWSNLLLYTDMEVNGISNRIASYIYDDLGRIISNMREGQAGEVRYSYDVNNNLRSITGRGFTEQIHYTTGKNKPLYNGNISSMTWTAGYNDRLYGFKFAYDELNRLTEAVYGEHETIATNPNRFTERVLSYSPNGSIKRFQRHGLKADGVYGKIDNLHLSYDGNQLVNVSDDAEAITRQGMFDFDDVETSGEEYFYNSAGALISDANRRIAAISYDYSGNPLTVTMENGNSIAYLYTPAGQHLRTVHATAASVFEDDDGDVEPATFHCDTTAYYGAVIYTNGQPDKLLFNGGYVTLGSTPEYYYYTCDHLGSNRAVVRSTDGLVVQYTSYYPFGGIIPELSSSPDLQPYKYSGKEFDRHHGLDILNYGARFYNPTIGRWDRIDPLCEKRFEISPYIFCSNNPINKIDFDGRSDFYDENGTLIKHIDDNSSAAFYQTGSGRFLHYEFDSSSVSDDYVNITSAIQEQQELNLNNPSLKQLDGYTYCNFATQNLMMTVQSIYPERSGILLTGKADDMYNSIISDKNIDYIEVTKEQAIEAAKAGLFVLLAHHSIENVENSGHFATFSVGENISKGVVANIGPKDFTGYVGINYAIRKTSQRKYFVLSQEYNLPTITIMP